jgi:hypothetical protein
MCPRDSTKRVSHHAHHTGKGCLAPRLSRLRTRTARPNRWLQSRVGGPTIPHPVLERLVGFRPQPRQQPGTSGHPHRNLEALRELQRKTQGRLPTRLLQLGGKRCRRGAGATAPEPALRQPQIGEMPQAASQGPWRYWRHSSSVRPRVSSALAIRIRSSRSSAQTLTRPSGLDDAN